MYSFVAWSREAYYWQRHLFALRFRSVNATPTSSRHGVAPLNHRGRCLSFDNGLAGAIHVTEAEALDVGCTATAVLALLLQPLLSGTGASQTPAPCQGVCRNPSGVALASPSLGEGEQVASIGGAFDLASMNTVGGMKGCALAGVVVDEAWPFVPLLGKIGLERVCDADWVRFEPTSSASTVGECGGVASGVASLPVVMFGC